MIRFAPLAAILIAILTACEQKPPPREATVLPPSHAVFDPENVPGVSGEGALRFRLYRGREVLPQRAIRVLKQAHGGFAVDRRAGKGEIYFPLPGVGVVVLAADLNSAELLGTDPQVAKHPLHNAHLWHTEEASYLSLPAIDFSGVYTIGLNGRLAHHLEPPAVPTSFSSEAANQYFAEGGPLNVTDVDVTPEGLYAVTGYSPLDHVLTATPQENAPFPSWAAPAFGGKGTGPGELDVGHGVTRTPDGQGIVVADRKSDELEYFALDGTHQRTVKLPAASLPCDVEFAEGLTLVACLNAPPGMTGAPIYLMRDDEIVSTIKPRDDLGLVYFTHVHNATLVKRDGRLYIIAQAWNPGDFAIFEQVIE